MKGFVIGCVIACMNVVSLHPFMPYQATAGTVQRSKLKTDDNLQELSQHNKINRIQFNTSQSQAKSLEGQIPELSNITIQEQRIIALTNKERTKRGLKPLKANRQLAMVARYKARDMRDRHYFSHYSPTFGSPFRMLHDFGVDFQAASEFIASGQKTPKEVVRMWMEKPKSKHAILSKTYNEIGVGLAKGGTHGYYWAQLFTG